MLQKMGVGTAIWDCLILAQSSSPAPDSIWEFVSRFGLPTVLVVLLMIGWYQRDKDQTARTLDNEMFIRSKLMAIVEEARTANVNAVSANLAAVAAIQELTRIVQRCSGPINTA